MSTTLQHTRAAAASVALAFVGLVAWPLGAAADVDVGVSIAVSQPGVYGRIDIGRFPQPQVVVAQPVVVVAPRHARPVQPVYMWVPPGHRKKWAKHCQSYGACGVPVVFVRDDWYERHVMPRDSRVDGRGDHGGDHGGGRSGDRGGKGQGRDKGEGHGRGREG